jgi:hypothetical protein
MLQQPHSETIQKRLMARFRERESSALKHVIGMNTRQDKFQGNRSSAEVTFVG